MAELLCCKMNINCLHMEDFSELLRSLPACRVKKAEAMRQEADKKRSASAALLLRYALGTCGLPENCVDYSENGRPFVHGREDLFISLSHSGDYAVCAMAPTPVSVDVQEHSGGTESIVRHAFSEREQALYTAGGSQAEKDRRFYDIWCRKECLAKLGSYQYVRDMDSFAPAPGYQYYGISMAEYSFALYTRESPGVLLNLTWSPLSGFQRAGEERFVLQEGAWNAEGD